MGRTIEVRGTAQHMVVLSEGRELARHARHTAAWLVWHSAHYDGESMPAVRAPAPFGRHSVTVRISNSQGIARLPVLSAVTRPMSAYISFGRRGMPISPIPKKVPIITLDPVAAKLAAFGL